MKCMYERSESARHWALVPWPWPSMRVFGTCATAEAGSPLRGTLGRRNFLFIHIYIGVFCTLKQTHCT